MRQRKAFTIVELLVVIGIIAVLIGILVPVVSSVRRAGYDASSKAFLTSIANAVERYHTDHQAYPGPLSQNQLYGGSIANAIPAGEVDPASDADVGGSGNTKISGAENLTLALLGGLSRDPGGNLHFVAADVGRGPMSLGTRPVRNAAYMEANATTLSQGYFRYLDSVRARDTAIPEFIDRFPDALPILYYRARADAPGVVGRQSQSAPWTALQYQVDDSLPYVVPNVSGTSIGSPGTKRHGLRFIGGASPDANDGQNYADAVDAYPYFENSALPGTPKRKNTFILIGAGVDRVYGTSDDNTN